MRAIYSMTKLLIAGLLLLAVTVLINQAYALPRDFDQRCENAWANGNDSFWHHGQEYICIEPEGDADPPWNHGHSGPTNAPDDSEPGDPYPSGGQTGPKPQPKPKQCTIADIETGCRAKLFSVNVLKAKTGKCLTYDDCFEKYKQYEEDNGMLSPIGRCLSCINNTCKNKIPPSDSTQQGFCWVSLNLGLENVVEFYKERETIKDVCGGSKKQCYDDL